jgi:tetratricopeptide (TPR) repeat protein
MSLSAKARSRGKKPGARSAPSQEKPSVAGNRNIRFKFLLVSLGIAVAAFVFTLPARNRMIREANRLNQNANSQKSGSQVLTSAVDAARSRSAATPADPHAHLALAQALFQQGKTSEALSSALVAFNRAPRDGQVAAVVGQLYDAAGRPDEAIEYYKKAIAANPTDGGPAALLAYRYLSLGWSDDARRILDTAINVSPRNPRLYVARGLIYHQTAADGAAEKALLKARELAPGDFTIIPPLIHVYRDLHNYAEALHLVDEGLAHDPADLSLQEERANILLESQQTRQAFDMAEQVLQKEPSRLDAKYVRALAQRNLGNNAAAIRDLEDIRLTEPSYRQTVPILSSLYFRSGKPDRGQRLADEERRTNGTRRAFERLTGQVANRSTDVAGHRQLGKFYLNTGQLPRAIIELRRMLELRPGDSEAQHLLELAMRAANGSNRSGRSEPAGASFPSH